MNTFLVIAGAIIAGLIASTVITFESDAKKRLPARKKGVKGPIVNFRYYTVPRYTRKGGQLVPLLNKRGEPLSRKIVTDTPAELAKAASAILKRPVPIAIDDFILATIIASEADSSYTPYMRGAIGNAVMNHQRAAGEHLFEILKNPAGAFADQLGGRYVSTVRPPTEEDLLIAEAISSGRLPDTTGGAVEFDSPRAQRALVASGVYSAENGPEAVAARRMRGGKVPFYLPNVNPDEIRFWVPKKAA